MGDHLSIVELGTGVTVTAVAAGTVHTCAILGTGHVKCWGDAAYNGLLGDGGVHYTSTNRYRGDDAGEMGDNLAVKGLGTGAVAIGLSAGLYDTCVVLSNGSVKCWGTESSHAASSATAKE